MFWKKIHIVVVLFAFQITCQLCQAQLKNWDGPNFGIWTGPFHWTPNGAPGPGNTVFIGVIAGTENSNVELDTFEQIQNLEIRNGSDLFLFDPGARLQVSGTTTIGGEFNGEASSLHISAGFGVDFQTDNLVIEPGGRFANFDSGDVNIMDQLTVESGGEVWANGEINFLSDSGRALSNDGLLRTNPGQLSLFQQGDARIDLDGETGNGVVRLMDSSGLAGNFDIVVNGTELYDSFSGTIEMATGSSLTMVLDNEWVADTNSLILIESQESAVGNLARIAGTAFRLEGTMLITDSFNNMGEPVEVDADMVIADGAVIELEQNTLLYIFDETTIDGATFMTASGSSSDGLIDISGPTSWSGVNNIFGTLTQTGDAIVNVPTNINAETIDLDGNGTTTWDIDSVLTVNASAIDFSDNVFNGSFYLDSSISALNLNIDSGETWYMDGELIMDNSFPFPVTKLRGTPVEFRDEVFVLNSGIRIEADSTFNSTSYIEFANANASLVLNAESTIHQDADFDGEGTLINGIAGELSLGNGFFQNQVSLINQGNLEIAEGPGIAVVPEFDNAATGFFRVEIGGPVAGTEFDFLTVSDELATLAGRIGVKLIDGFQPSIGDEFTVLSAPVGIAGQFSNSPVSVVDGNGYIWEVLHNPFDVTVRLDSVESDVLLGDVNQDGVIDLLDVIPFTNTITSGIYDIRADMNCDGVVDLLDVTPFVERLAS